MKKVLIAALMMGAALSSQAQNEWFQNVKFSGYGMVQYQASDKDEAETNGFNLRLVRIGRPCTSGFLLEGADADQWQHL